MGSGDWNSGPHVCMQAPYPLSTSVYFLSFCSCHTLPHPPSLSSHSFPSLSVAAHRPLGIQPAFLSLRFSFTERSAFLPPFPWISRERYIFPEDTCFCMKSFLTPLFLPSLALFTVCLNDLSETGGHQVSHFILFLSTSLKLLTLI